MQTSVSVGDVGGRRSLLKKVGAVIIGASAATLLQQKKAVAAPTPVGCYGLPGCDSGCGTTVRGDCCWYWTDSHQCRTYRCCDVYGLPPTSPCICRYIVGNFC
jgi:hypothetical protein